MDATYFHAQLRRRSRANWLSAALTGLSACLERSRQRRDLAGLSNELLKDIGLTRADVARECSRWPWDGPSAGKPGGPRRRVLRQASAR
jgi:uncharacterized protein YjiS (DUF1127 family)